MPLESDSIGFLIVHGTTLLTPCSDSARLDAQVLLCFVLKKERSYLLTWPEKQLTKREVSSYLALLIRRQKGEPIAYITGVKEFWSLPFKVSPATLIPRPDTEILVELVLNVFHERKQANCLDLGTGTGAIALALASEMPLWHIEAIDYSKEAVSLAKLNARQLGLSQVKIFQSDWFSHVNVTNKFELIVSNPPYIDEFDDNLVHGDVRFEPKSALVANEQGLADIKCIARESRNYLAKKGKLFFEHGFQQGAHVRNILSALGYQGIQTVKDLNEHERITWAEVPASI